MSDATPVPVHSPEDAALLRRLRAGEDTAYTELVRRYGGRLLAVATRLLRSEDDARDALQDAFISAFRAIHSFEGNSKLSTWLHRIVVNAALMKLRAKTRKREVSIDDLQPRFDEDGQHLEDPAEWRAPEQLGELERQEARKLVRKFIDELPEDYRTVLLLRDIEELNTQETADVLGVTPNAAKIRLHRARHALRAKLDPHMRKRGLA